VVPLIPVRPVIVLLFLMYKNVPAVHPVPTSIAAVLALSEVTVELITQIRLSG
jgi:hypothetical protein